ncbi:MAG: hypothetical protein BWY99_02513 [Synergistetes bacterium ADurb.BinA166]|nr:MAG: hypothetical protein BWY99_02513 [Synergistetes bacterium ADurb.BinA166]
MNRGAVGTWDAVTTAPCWTMRSRTGFVFVQKVWRTEAWRRPPRFTPKFKARDSNAESMKTWTAALSVVERADLRFVLYVEEGTGMLTPVIPGSSIESMAGKDLARWTKSARKYAFWISFEKGSMWTSRTVEPGMSARSGSEDRTSPMKSCVTCF